MVAVTLIAASGGRFDLTASPGYSLMEAAVRAEVPGIRADCGGGCACATCHVHIDDAWIDRTGRATGNEAEMLDFANAVTPASRLACQIIMDGALDGLVARVVERD